MRFNRVSKSVLSLGASALALWAGSAQASAAAGTEEQPAGNAVETVVVTAQKRQESVQDVPIAVSAFGQGTLDKLNIDGGPNLLLAIPNVTFSKGNFTGSNFTIRGVGSRAVGASADATVGVHQNGAPLTANLLFEAEFYDVERVEVLRGPQGTLYGRNATGGVINLITAKPRPGTWDGSAEVTLGNYDTARVRAHVNMPLGENWAFRLAATGTSRRGYGDNLTTLNDIDGRNLYAYRASIGGDITDNLRVWASYDYFNENDNRVRASKQLCRSDPGRTNVGGVPVLNTFIQNATSQGCLPAAITDPSKLGVVNVAATLGGLVGNLTGLLSGNPAAGLSAPRDVRDVFAAFDPIYRAEQKLTMGQIEWDITPSLSLTYMGSYNTTRVFSNEDYNKLPTGAPFNTTAVSPGGVVTDPQLGTSRFLRTYDISAGDSEQTTHELRLQSDFDGQFNFTVGGIKIDFETVADYYVFSNSLSAFAQLQNFLSTIPAGALGPGTATGPNVAIPLDPGRGASTIAGNVTDTGRNYFLSRTPYQLDAYALFGELYYSPTETLRTTLGLRYTSDEKSQQILSPLLLANVGTVPAAVTTPFLRTGQQFASFEEVTGKFNIDWKPELDFTDDTLLYLTFARGYKGGGINPPGSVGVGGIRAQFEPEFINSIELGTKNTLLDGSLQANGSVFYYDYQGYQVSKIVNRTSANENIDASVFGIEFEGVWRPTDNWTLNATIGYLTTEIGSGRSIDTLNRTQGNAAWTVVKASDASNCMVPTAALGTLIAIIQGLPGAPVIPGVTGNPTAVLGACGGSFAALGVTPRDGFEVDLTGKEMPSSPEFTVALGAEYNWDIGTSWSALARLDYYWQAESFARVYNTVSDQLPSWSNINATVRLNHEDGFYAEFYVKNLTDEEVITDAYLTDDSSGLFTNVFYTEPRTFGLTLGRRF